MQGLKTTGFARIRFFFACECAGGQRARGHGQVSTAKAKFQVPSSKFQVPRRRQGFQVQGQVSSPSAGPRPRPRPSSKGHGLMRGQKASGHGPCTRAAVSGLGATGIARRPQLETSCIAHARWARYEAGDAACKKQSRSSGPAPRGGMTAQVVLPIYRCIISSLQSHAKTLLPDLMRRAEKTLAPRSQFSCESDNGRHARPWRS